MAASSTRRIHRFLVLSCVSYVASHAAAVSFNYSSCGPAVSRHDTSFAGNTTVGGHIFGVLALDDRCSSRALPHVSGVSSLAIRRGSAITRHVILTTTDHVDSSIDGSLTLVERPQLSNWSAEFLSPIFPLSQEQIRGLVSEISKYTFDACSGSPVGSLESQGHQNTWRNGIVYHTRPYTHSGQHFEWPSNWLPHEPAGTRKLLSGTYGRSATTQHAATRWQEPSSWLKPASVAASALVGLICAVAGFVLCCIRSKRQLQSTAAIELEDDEQIVAEPKLRRGLDPLEFVHSELAAATDNFAEERKIGRGGFGPVYRGYLREEDRHVAIKALSPEQPVQGLKEFQAEVTIMSQLRHRSIVRLVGWCGRRRQLALVYELMPGGSLDTHLYNPDRHLTWSHKYKIALQLGSALRYLHTDCDQCVVHGDIKPANVMLDASLDAKLGDFGLARLVDHGAEPQTTQVVAGTVGYIDPEFVNSRRPSAESDVYSFGIVLLEIACGRRPTRRSDQVASAALLALVRDMYRRNVILDAADRKLDGEFDRMQMERMLVTGLWCAHQDPAQRPSIAQAVDVLRSENAELPVLGTMGGSGEIRALEGQAYGDLFAEMSSHLHESTETTYLTTKETAYLFQEQW